MEHTLLCNDPKCRRELTGRALVTTCSHIFCLDCVQKSGLVGQGDQRCTVCPICNVQLPKEEDVAFTSLNPTEEFKTCVLSGKSPNVIMECAGRAISFWSYQVTHDLHYQRHLCKSLREKLSALWDQYDQLNRDYSTENNSLREKLKSLTASRDALQQKNNELAAAYQDKSRKLFQTHELYNRVKKRAELSQIEQAAFEAVDSSTRSVPQPSTGNQASNVFRSHSLNGNNEHSFPLNRGPPRFDAADFVSGLPVSNMQQYESDSRWPRKRPQAYEQIPEIPPFNQSANGRLSAEIFRPSVSSNIEPSRRDDLRPSAVSPNFPQQSNVWAGVGLTSGMKIGQPGGHSGQNGSLKDL